MLDVGQRNPWRVKSATLLATVAVFGSLTLAPAASAQTPSPEIASPEVANTAPSPSATALTPTTVIPTTGTPTTGTTAELAQALAKNLGLTLEEFTAAGELGKRAADLRDTFAKLPGFEGIALRAIKTGANQTSSGAINGGDQEIVVTGSGAELQAAVVRANAADPSVLVVLEPGTATAAAPKTTTPTNAVTDVPVTAATDVDSLFAAYVREVGTAGLQAVMFANGHFVIRTGQAATGQINTGRINAGQINAATSKTGSATGSKSPQEFIASYSNVELREANGAAQSEDDLLGGEGVRINGDIACSAGFNAFDSTGKPTLLTAGHCSEDSTVSKVETVDQTGEPAVTGNISTFGSVTGHLGTFGFSQFGGPGNASVSPTGGTNQVGTDVSVVQQLAPAVTAQPAVTAWEDASNLNNRAPKVIGVTQPVVGMPICRSGRTTGWSCGTVQEVGVFLVEGYRGPDDVRAVSGFSSNTVESNPGDSGGSWISGGRAVGLHSAGGFGEGINPGSPLTQWAFGASLVDALKVIPGAQIRLYLNTPALLGSAAKPKSTAFAGSKITGVVTKGAGAAVPTGSKVRIVSSGNLVTLVALAADGTFAFNAPQTTGAFSFTAQTVNGFSTSASVPFSVNITPAPLPAPVLSSPAPGAKLTAPVQSLSGTGTPGAAVVISIVDGRTLAADARPTTTVNDDGTWTIRLASPLGLGRHEVTAHQEGLDRPNSASVKWMFSVVKPVPVVTATPTASSPVVVPAGTASPNAPNTDVPNTDLPNSDLPNTGASAGLWALGLGGGGLLAAGLGLVRVRPRAMAKRSH
ncbi:S1 family peptidase [Pseudarthrobacter sp. J1738]|uniref:S1 family peptidase n=1 Tax=Pseudarthrobacter sp. J1738 TaxID=3420446 RepID=UPI003D26E69D